MAWAATEHGHPESQSCFGFIHPFSHSPPIHHPPTYPFIQAASVEHLPCLVPNSGDVAVCKAKSLPAGSLDLQGRMAPRINQPCRRRGQSGGQ